MITNKYTSVMLQVDCCFVRLFHTDLHICKHMTLQNIDFILYLQKNYEMHVFNICKNGVKLDQNISFYTFFVNLNDFLVHPFHTTFKYLSTSVMWKADGCFEHLFHTYLHIYKCDFRYFLSICVFLVNLFIRV